MSAVDELLADLAAHPPLPPTPVTEIRGRARRRTRRRRALVATTALVAAVLLGAGLVVAVGVDDPGDEVTADGGTTTPPTVDAPNGPSSVPGSTDEVPTTTGGPVATEPPTMTLDPATGHEDGTVVTMALDEPASGPALVAQCSAEAEAYGDGSTEIASWCTGLVEMQAEDLRPFTLTRTISTPVGVVDCAEAVGRCTLGVRVGGTTSTDDRFAPLAFREDLPALAEPTVEVDGDEGTVGDGDALLVTVRGVSTGEGITVQQCRSDAADAFALSAGDGCDHVRSLRAVVQDGPETQLTFTAFHDVFLDVDPSESYEPGWVRCEPCEVVVWVDGDVLATRLSLDMEPTDAPIRPTIAVEPAGPHTWGERVTVRATGLQPRDTVPIGWCPTTPPQGGGATACWSERAEWPEEHPVGDDGTVVIGDFALPGPDDFVGTDCAVPGACGVGIDVMDGSWTMAIAPLDLSG